MVRSPPCELRAAPRRPLLYADLRRLSEDEKGSLTCQYLGLTTGCCLTLAFIFPIVLLILFGLMRLRPAFIVLSLIVLSPMCFFLSWVMFIEFRCVVAWFVLVSGWLIGTVLYALRRRHSTRPTGCSVPTTTTRGRPTCVVGDRVALARPGGSRRVRIIGEQPAPPTLEPRLSEASLLRRPT